MKLARLTMDLEPELRDSYKAACALAGSDMVTEVRKFITGFVSRKANSKKGKRQ